MSERRKLNVRELLELERQIYQESIDRVLKQQGQLTAGILEDFVRRCKPFEEDRNCELKVAQKQLEFSRQDALSLLEFDLQHAEDVYQAQRMQSKRKLLEDTRRRRARVEQRLRALKERPFSTSNLKAKATHVVDDFAVLKKCQLQPKLLKKQLMLAQKQTRKFFNFRHLSDGLLPTPERIVNDVMKECKKVRQSRVHEEMARKAVQQGAEPIVQIDNVEDGQKMRCRRNEIHSEVVDETFNVGDAVVLESQLTEEDFYGFVSAFTNDEVKLVLVCGTHVRVAIARLRSGQCILRKQPEVFASIDIGENGHKESYQPVALSGVATSLQELLQDPPDVRRRAAAVLNRLKRKTTIDIRRGF